MITVTNKRMIIFLIIAVALMLQNCCGWPHCKGRIKPIIKLKEGVTLTKFEDLVLETKSNDDVPITSSDQERIIWLIIKKVQERQLFERINVDQAPSGASSPILYVTINFTKYQKGSAFARLMLAGLGQVRIYADVILREYEKNETLTKYEVKKTFAGGGIIGVSMGIEDVEEGFAETIAIILDKASKGK